ncbi:hypothetical protein EV643_101196 [Kribbella sp. VKM Ac-2527]|uniref:Uncharacterized protein n=1 Tax=Kribbella caucasensis TaxID=2512215 RepID=A0A4R6KTP6_9ACTN|nr:hypothetical protein [Kribbella sp. VKM Ac-2527]TDO54407.1 hypothetical protein EV643_101196 [Kribbella sp. VKM Ac-2527]
MGGRWVGALLLVCGLLGIAAVGTAGGYGVGLLTSSVEAGQRGGARGLAGPLTPIDTPSSTPTSTPPMTAKPDNTRALKKSELEYRTRSFVARAAVQSHVTVRVPSNWTMTFGDPPTWFRFTDPLAKRWVRIEAGFTIKRRPMESLEERISNLMISPGAVRILSKQGDPVSTSATLTYTHIKDEALRHVIVRWVSLDDSGLCAAEVAVTGLPQDRKALEDIMEHAADSITRSDEPLS